MDVSKKTFDISLNLSKLYQFTVKNKSVRSPVEFTARSSEKNLKVLMTNQELVKYLHTFAEKLLRYSPKFSCVSDNANSLRVTR